METTAGAASNPPGNLGRKKLKKGQKQGRQANTNVAESTRINIAKILEEFQATQEREYTFEENLTNHERAAVHILCRKMGMKSKSSGRGDRRRVSVFKTKKTADITNGRENLTCFTFSEESRNVLQTLFMHHPPGDEEMNQVMAEKNDGRADKVRERTDDTFCKPLMSKSEIVKKMAAFTSRVEKSQNLSQITEERAKLPIASFRDVITSSIDTNQVVLICGETGCGKTTQVPQFILDHMWGKEEASKIVCTQPRRISAISVAERIASERGEKVGETVGYKIRLESKGGRHSSIVFCTSGVFLRVLVSKGGPGTGRKRSKRPARNEASDITHIIVDEIHERDRYADFMLAILRDTLPLYPHLRLVLMSATIDADRFSTYFGGCPIIRVPGFTHPVKIHYLEDVLSIVKSNEATHLNGHPGSIQDAESDLSYEDTAALDEAIDLALCNDEVDLLRDLISSEVGQKYFNHQHSSTGVTPLMLFAGKGSVGDVCMLLSLGADCNIKDKDGMTSLDWAKQESKEECIQILEKHMGSNFPNSQEEQHLIDKYLSSVNPELVDDVLIEKLLRRICADSDDGAILVFLPGWDDINRTRERLHESSYFKDSSRFIIISLHSMVPSAEQKKVFRRPVPGCRKIVLSTNIAETAITIDDVVFVIDSGRMKEKSYDPYNNVSTLQSSWISKASAKQREGRAGRCQPGICYHLYSKIRAESLPDFQVPEIRRMPVEELCLQVKILDPDCKIEEFLQKTLDPPLYETIRNAVIVLQDIGALSLDEKLTELGKMLGSLPVHPLTSKMLFIAILLNCLDPALTLACTSDYRDPFTLPMLPNEKKRAAAAKSELASLFGGLSDQLAVVAAFECWKCAKERGQEARFCSQYFVSSGTMNMLSGLRKQLQSELLRNGFLSGDESRYSLNAHDPGVLHSVLVAGLYPMVGRLLPPLKGGRRPVIETASGDKVRLHPHSTNFKLPFRRCDGQPLIVYDEITRGDGGLYIRNCSIVGPLPLLLLSTEIVVAPLHENSEDADEDDNSEYENDNDTEDEKTGNNKISGAQPGDKIMSSPDNTVQVIVDRWLSFKSTAVDVAQIYCLRERLSAAILFQVSNPGKVLPEFLGASISAALCILSFDGMAGIAQSSEPVEGLATMDDITEISQSGSERKKGTDLKHNSFLSSLIYGGKGQNSASRHQKTGMSASAVVRYQNKPLHHKKPAYPKRPRGTGS